MLKGLRCDSAPARAADQIHCRNQIGQTFALKPTRHFEPLATNTLAEGCLASPAVSGNALFLRTKTDLYRIEQPGGELTEWLLIQSGGDKRRVGFDHPLWRGKPPVSPSRLQKSLQSAA